MTSIKRRSEEDDRIEVIKLFDIVWFGLRVRPNHAICFFTHGNKINMFARFDVQTLSSEPCV